MQNPVPLEINYLSSLQSVKSAPWTVQVCSDIPVGAFEVEKLKTENHPDMVPV